jgi:general secretion pathway protein G
MRTAIDGYKRLRREEDRRAGHGQCYPLTLEGGEGQLHSQDASETKTVRFLARIPVDPFTGEADWGKRSYQDDWDSANWGGENVYDVYSLSQMRALDDTYYRDW